MSHQKDQIIKWIVFVSEKEVEYIIEEDDKYYLEVINTNPRSIIMKMNLNVSSKMYDLTKAQDKCSTTNGSCVLGLLFPNTHYVIVTTPNNVCYKSQLLKKKLFC